MEDNSVIKKIGIAKLNGLNYRSQATLTRAIIEAKNTQGTIEPQLGLEAKTSTIDNGTAPKGDRETKLNYIIDIKACTVIIGYCGQEALSRIVHLQSTKEQQNILKHTYLPTSRRRLSIALQKFYKFIPKPNISISLIATGLQEVQRDIFNIDPLQQPIDKSTTIILFTILQAINLVYRLITLQLKLQDIYRVGKTEHRNQV